MKRILKFDEWRLNGIGLPGPSTPASKLRLFKNRHPLNRYPKNLEIHSDLIDPILFTA